MAAGGTRETALCPSLEDSQLPKKMSMENSR